MTVQTLKIGKREFVLLSKQDYEKLAAQAQRQAEDDYWTESALRAETKARVKGQKPISFEAVERQLDARKRTSGKRIGRGRR